MIKEAKKGRKNFLKNVLKIWLFYMKGLEASYEACSSFSEVFRRNMLQIFRVSDPDPQNQILFGLPGSGSVIICAFRDPLILVYTLQYF
jgi:phosphatidylserine decarboxylase